jgi:hypothetical protein
VARVVEPPLLRVCPEAVLLVHEGVNPVEDGTLSHNDEA